VLLNFLADNPNDVLLLWIEDYVYPKPLTDALVASGLAAYAHTYDRASPATLGEMIDRNERLLIMHDFRGMDVCLRDSPVNPMCEAPAWYHDNNLFLYQTSWKNLEIEDFDCGFDPQETIAPLTQINHYLYTEDAAKMLSDDWYAGTGVNSWEVMQPRLQRCWRQLAARFGYDFSFPNIVVVNFYELGDPMAVVDWLNTQRGQGLPPEGAAYDQPQPPLVVTSPPPPVVTSSPAAAAAPSPEVSAASTEPTSFAPAMRRAPPLVAIAATVCVVAALAAGLAAIEERQRY